MIPGFRERSLFLRDAQGSGLVEAFVIIGILTILLTRAYLHLTGYPQVGGSSLHIAHVLWGGLGMIVALVTVFSFLGRKPRMVAVVVGGIGFGLFLDEIGKFVTKTNDYFYRPSVAIMYVVIVVLLLLNRWLHDVRPPTVTEDVANAAAIALGGLDRGLDRVRREQALAQLRRAGRRGRMRRQSRALPICSTAVPIGKAEWCRRCANSRDVRHPSSRRARECCGRLRSG